MLSFILSMVSQVKLKNKTCPLIYMVFHSRCCHQASLALHQSRMLWQENADLSMNILRMHGYILFRGQVSLLLGVDFLVYPLTTCGPLQAGPQDGIANIHYLGHPEPFAQGHENRRPVERVGEGCGDQGCDRQRRHHCMHHIKEFSEAAAHRQSSLTHTPPGLSLLHLTPSAGSP